MTIKSWDDYMDALDELPLWAQYAARQRIFNIINTDLQLQKLGIPYPHKEPVGEGRRIEVNLPPRYRR
jgi:hypothetical protein